MKKRNVATVMAAAMTLGTVAPSFAAVVSVDNPTGEQLNGHKGINTATANGKDVQVKEYKDIYNTNFTEDKKDDVLKPGYEILDKVEVKKDGVVKDLYVVAVPFTTAQLTDTKKAEIKTEKENFEDTEAYIERLVARGYVLTKSTTKATLNADNTLASAPVTTYKLTRGTGTSADTIYVKHVGTVYTKAEEAKTDSITISAKEYIKDTDKETTASIAQRAKEHRTVSKWAYDIKQMSNVEVEKVEFNDDATSNYNKHLQLNVYKKAEKAGERTLVAEYKIMNFDKFDKSLFVDVVAKNDFTKHWAEKEIFNAMYAGNIDNTGTFRPQDSITRAEFVKILVNSFGVDTKAADKYKNPFTDVKEGSWEHKYVVAAYVAGVVEGDGDGTFRPNAPISRQEAAKMVATLAASQKKTYTVGSATKDIKGETFDTKGNHVAVKTNFRDDKNIAVWADESILELSSAKVLEGYGDGNFKPENSITRAESIVMMDKAASKLN